jgi:hypothetical protein
MMEIKTEVLKQMWRDLSRIEKIEFAAWVAKDLNGELITRYTNEQK